MFTVSEEFIIYAFRYALGRLTSAPYDVAIYIQENKGKLSKFVCKLMIDEINQFINVNKETHPRDLIELWDNTKLVLMKENNNE